MRTPLALLLLAALSAPAAAQPDGPHWPTAEERAWLARCLDAADAGDIAAGQCLDLICAKECADDLANAGYASV
jgi:hypothetical protein